jgi:DNA-binding response OmpR family regulator
MTTVLLVADSEWVVNDVRGALGFGAWELSVLDDPREAVTRVEETSPDTVLVDLQVASMGGMAVVRDIRAVLDPEERPRLVLMLDREADEFLARRAGADAWVVKPFSTHQLRQVLGVPLPT